ncbi:MAG TPA: DUF4091 domain-containing protein [Clostridiales bacterium]|nr:DUF4091 domain-containing protein [Clostridiales bacterium]HQK73680.1 DUF4091 domain-containing protein [Clostridiales bacterium]
MFTCLTLSSLAKVFADEKPENTPLRTLSMLKNERASFQTALFAQGKDALALDVEIDSPLAGSIKIYQVEAIASALPAYKDHDDYYMRTESGLFPDLLRPVGGSISLKPEQWQSVWFEIDPDGAISAGEYTVAVAFRCAGETLACAQVGVELIDACLPAQTLIHTNWFHTDCLATWYKTEVFSEEYWRITENYLRNAARHGMNMVLTPLFTPPLDTLPGGERPTVQLVGVQQQDGRYRFDLSRLKRWVEMCGRCGISYFEMSHLFTQWGARHAPKIEAEADGRRVRLFGWNTWGGSKKYTGFLTEFAQSLNAFLDENGIKERCFFHVSDEPSAAQYAVYQKRSRLVRALFPGSPVIDALSDFKFYVKGAVETPIPATDHIEPFIGRVPELWAYYCCGQHKGYVSNRFFAMPSQRNRVLGMQLYKFGVKGFLQWGHNFWYAQFSKREINPFEESDAGKAFPSGDAFAVYPGENGAPLNSLRLKVFYDALQDMRALQLLESLVGRDKTLALLEQGLGEPLTFSSYPHSEDWQLDKRRQINEAIRHPDMV